MRIDRLLHSGTTLITSTYNGRQLGSATGFFYSELEGRPNYAGGEPGWKTVKDTWLLTNRHVVLPRELGGERFPDVLTFRFRTLTDQVEWTEVHLSREQLRDCARVHQHPDIDIAALRISDKAIPSDSKDAPPLIVQSATNHDLLLPGNPIEVTVGSDVLVAGYPHGFYDLTSTHPAVKAGVVASGWRLPWQGLPRFLIDARLFPGSSGSIVITKPQQFAAKEGQMLFSPEPVVALLGIYSGAVVWHGATDTLDLGVVWYAELIPECIETGSLPPQALTE